MINFFRTFRKSQVRESKPYKYLLYALGEIFLVVVGILIALQINNWNENRRTHAKNLQNLSSLHIELKNNLETIEVNLEEIEDQVVFTIIGLDSLNNNIVPDNRRQEFLTDLIQELGPIRVTPFNTTVLDELVNSGNYSEIESDDIKGLMLNYKTNLDNYEKFVEDFREYFRLNEFPYYVKYFSLLDMWKKGSMKDDINAASGKYKLDATSLLESDQYFENDLSAYYNNREFSTMITGRRFELTHIYRNLVSLKETVIKLIDTIEEERER